VVIPKGLSEHVGPLLQASSEIRPDAAGHDILNAFFGLTENPMTAEDFDRLVREAKGELAQPGK
jgi:hypothetical protein